uniref:Uncharacterized protein n=1 Tax=Parascaris equorum TaxID=6256 RepID=A0A914RTZ7_PAREQ
MPQTFSGFLAGGRTSNGFDLESFTKNAAIETNKHSQHLGNQRSAFGLVETPNEQLFERGMQRARPVGGVTISQRPLTDADKIGTNLN